MKLIRESGVEKVSSAAFIFTQEIFMKITYRVVIAMAALVVTLNASVDDIHAVRLTTPISVDGKLDEPIWSRIPPVTDFHQREPDQGAQPSQKTKVWVVYDDDALYIAARMYDTHPDSIVKVLGRKDYFTTADWFGVYIDAYRDKRSGNFFYIGPSGTVGDGVLYNDDWDDQDWDGVWEGKSNVDDKGWTMEMRIPLSQLRFNNTPNQVWGINFERDIGRRNEQDYLVYTPRMQSGFVSRFPALTGIEGIKPVQSVEVMPFVTSKAQFTHPPGGNPFDDGRTFSPDAGIDFRYGLANNLTLNATVNPDFGQVEVDPAVVNLSDVESYFQEKRPFFVEGANIFTAFGQGGGRNYWNFNFPTPTFFYSRRIGRTPHGNDTLDNADYIDMPIATRILGAGKIIGKLSDSWNVGTIHAVTGREHAPFQLNNVRGQAEVEPLSYYGVARVQKEFPDSRQGLGFMGTYALHDFSADPIGSKLQNTMNHNALFAGVDGWTFLDNDKAWVITGYTALSRVEGNRDRILSVQENSQHYFQRPDASYLSVDSNATSLTGYIGRAYLIKQKGNSYFNSSIGIIDPKFEINDLGFLSRTDVVNMHIGGGYVWSEPEGIFRVRELGGGFGQSYDYGGDLFHRVLVEWVYVQFTNFYSINLNFAQNPSLTYNDRKTRGGPQTLNRTGIEFDVNANTDQSKAVYANAYLSSYDSPQSKSFYYGANIQFRPASNVTFSIGPNIGMNNENSQWVDAYDDPTAAATYGKQYVFGELEQKTISADIRLNWTFTPQISLQLFMQPLISSGSYRNLKTLVRPRTDEYTIFGTGSSTLIRSVDPSSGDVSYTVDADGPGSAPSYTIDNPDFNFKSLRGNAVLRWEYLPGSILYFVWTQNRSDFENIGQLQFNHSLYRLGNSQPDNIFLIKMSYYLNI